MLLVMPGTMSNKCFFPPISVILAVICILVITTACAEDKNRRKAETYLLPMGYVGSVYVVFNVTNGAPPSENDIHRTYVVPSDGLLLTQMDLNEGFIAAEKIKFFYADESGNRVRIKDRLSASVKDTPKNRAETTVYIFADGLGSIDSATLPCTLFYRGFYVGQKRHILDAANHFSLMDDVRNNSVSC
jgi:hypothetical protein